jgi:hypothetical protein
MSTTRNAGRQLIKAALEAGFTVAVHYEQDDKPAMTRKGVVGAVKIPDKWVTMEHLNALWSEATACDEATVYITDHDKQLKGWAYLVHWNEGDEVISDHSASGWVNAWAEATNYGQRSSLICPHLRLDPDHRPVRDGVW